MNNLLKSLKSGEPSPQASPEWIRISQAIKLFGIGRSSLFALIRQKRIASKVLRTHPHNIGGLRLISTESLRALIEASSDE